MDNKRGRMPLKVSQRVDGKVWIWFFNPLSSALLTSNSFPAVELDLMWFSPFSYSHCPSQQLTQITKALEGLWWFHLSLPIILGEGLSVHVEKVPILHFLPASDSSLTSGRSDENPPPAAGNSTAKRCEGPNRASSWEPTSSLNCLWRSQLLFFWGPSCYCCPPRHPLWWESPGDHG